LPSLADEAGKVYADKGADPRGLPYVPAIPQLLSEIEQEWGSFHIIFDDFRRF
jgi:hypothetical protein